MQGTKNQIHTPVLLEAVLQYLSPRPGESYLDVTAGYGGHAKAVLTHTKASDKATLVDRDAEAIAHLKQFEQAGAQVVHNDFLGASQDLAKQGKKYDLILADLGVSSLHLNQPDRGFAFMHDGPLDMRMDQSSELSASDVVNSYDETELADLLFINGEERRSRKIASAIVNARPINSTAELAGIIEKTIGRRGKTHPATKSFQAIRITVNDELKQVENSLPIWLSMLNPGGRLGVISFHSLEDRLVKQVFTDVSGDRYDSDFRILTKNPVVADDGELAFNPRSRSAKLRVVAKIKNRKG